MNVVSVVPGTDLKAMIEAGASKQQIAQHVKQAALDAGLRGEVAIMIDLPEGGHTQKVPTTFQNVA